MTATITTQMTAKMTAHATKMTAQMTANMTAHATKMTAQMTANMSAQYFLQTPNDAEHVIWCRN